MRSDPTALPVWSERRSRISVPFKAVEFRTRPASLEGMARAVDDALQTLNTDYRTKRAGDVGMAAPRVTTVPPGTFHRWLAARDKLGDQHKVPRASNQRVVIEAILATDGAPSAAD
jgi:hypothetical protein